MAPDTSLSDVVQVLDLAAERIAIELNQMVVRRVNWPETLLHENDRIEIVHFVGGGAAGTELRGNLAQLLPDKFRV